VALLAGIVAGAFAVRVLLTYRSVFGQEFVAFVETDAWYHMRLVDALVRDFPWRIWHDPYLVHPGGEPVNAGPVFDWIVAGAALLLGGGAPSPRLIDVVGAYTPPVLGALVALPVYVLGREMFSRAAGLWAAFIVSVLPGQILQRSVLGFTDHHCAEVLFSTTALALVVLATSERRPARGRLFLSLAGGVALGTYLLTWGGGVLVVAVLVGWATLHIVSDQLRRVEGVVVLALLPALLVAMAMVLPWAATRPHFGYQVMFLMTGGLILLGAWSSGIAARRFRVSAAAQVACLGVLALCAALLAVLVFGERTSAFIADAKRVSPFRPAGVVGEARPLMASELWRPIPLWKEFTTSLVLAVVGAGWLGGRQAEGAGRGALLLGCWSAAMLMATFGQVRFTYYLAVCVALLAAAPAAALSAHLVAWTRRRDIRAVATVVVASALAAPGAVTLWPVHRAEAQLTADWRDALTWLQDNTPEPFGDPNQYYRTVTQREPSGASYGVMAWWDYGYWITRVARRVPVSNPRQTGMGQAAAFMMAAGETEGNSTLDAVGARYVIVDWQLQAVPPASPTGGFFAAIARAAGTRPQDYCGQFVDPALDETTIYCYPEYYQTMAMRLYLHAGRATEPPASVSVVSYVEEVRDRQAVKRITGERRFPTYEEAAAHVARVNRPDTRIICRDPHRTCVPLEPLDRYTVVFRSLGREHRLGRPGPSFVQVYEYAPAPVD
jgi:oligosaccharyl transferase (archaeosortase A-associated)